MLRDAKNRLQPSNQSGGLKKQYHKPESTQKIKNSTTQEKKSRKIKWCLFGRVKLETPLPIETHENQLFTDWFQAKQCGSNRIPGFKKALAPQARRLRTGAAKARPE